MPNGKAPVGVGEEFGRGVVINPDAGRYANGMRRVRLLCDPRLGGCGKTYETRTSSLRNGSTRSCGCLRLDRLRAKIVSHGFCSHPLYKTWLQMVHRCENPRNDHYADYGGRGITVWGPWHDPARFIADIEDLIGPRPFGMTGKRPTWTLNRKDNNGNYEPGNVEWADWRTQRRNSRPGAGYRKETPRGD
jgi:hypothetical protein